MEHDDRERRLLCGVCDEYIDRDTESFFSSFNAICVA